MLAMTAETLVLWPIDMFLRSLGVEGGRTPMVTWVQQAAGARGEHARPLVGKGYGSGPPRRNAISPPALGRLPGSIFYPMSECEHISNLIM